MSLSDIITPEPEALESSGTDAVEWSRLAEEEEEEASGAARSSSM